MPTCFDCGASVDPEDRFCGNCGIALGARGPAAAGEGTPGPDPAAAEPSPLPEAGGPSKSVPLEQDDSEQFQATLIEFAQGGGQAAAAARAHEPVEEQGPAEPAGEARSQSSNLSSDLYNSSTVVEPSGDSNAVGQTPDAAQPASQSSGSQPINAGASD